ILESAAELEKPAVELWHALTALGVPTLQESPFQRLEDEWRQQDPQAAWWLFLHMDGDWWFEQTYDSERLQADFGNRFAGKAAQIEQAREKLREFRKALEQKSIAGPPNYFAILVADGDRVGDWIRGDDLLPQWSESLHPALRRVAPPGRRPASLLTHLALSQCLGNLPRFLRPVIESEFDGALVYAGGDELLAFVPVARLAAGMQAYTETFSKSYEVQHGGYWLLPGKKFTASAAAFVVRHTDPLQGAVQEAHALLEGEAKENYGRQAGVIAVRRQSGQTTVMGTKWNPLAVSAAPFALLQELADCLATKQASPRFISHVAELGRGLVAVPSPDALQKMFEAILRRAAGEAASQGKAVLQGLSALLCGYNNLLYVLPRDSVGKLEFHPWKQLENALLVARFLARRG
ncbi:MAG: type III-B CRISPR-associated protein Cas10/Cmr2, partial [Bryobacteraceae bacterium]